MTSKNPDSLMKALLLSGTADTNIPRNFKPYINVTSKMSLSSYFNNSNIIDILLDPNQKNFSDYLNQLTKEKIVEIKSFFARIDKTKALTSIFTVLWYSTLPCFDLMGFTSRCKFHKHFMISFFLLKYFAQLFRAYGFGFAIFWQKEICAKPAH